MLTKEEYEKLLPLKQNFINAKYHQFSNTVSVQDHDYCVNLLQKYAISYEIYNIFCGKCVMKLLTKMCSLLELYEDSLKVKVEVKKTNKK